MGIGPVGCSSDADNSGLAELESRSRIEKPLKAIDSFRTGLLPGQVMNPTSAPTSMADSSSKHQSDRKPNTTAQLVVRKPSVVRSVLPWAVQEAHSSVASFE